MMVHVPQNPYKFNKFTSKSHAQSPCINEHEKPAHVMTMLNVCSFFSASLQKVMNQTLQHGIN